MEEMITALSNLNITFTSGTIELLGWIYLAKEVLENMAILGLIFGCAFLGLSIYKKAVIFNDEHNV